MIRIAVFASGAGTNACHLLKVSKGLKNVSIPLVVIDQESSPLISTGPKQFSETHFQLIPKLKSKEEHEVEIVNFLKEYGIDWVFLAGYMRIIGPTLLNAFLGKMINLHPSLLPAYPGLNAYERAFQNQDEVSGVSIHFVDSGIDTGMILRQESFKRESHDTLSTFISKGKSLEWKLFEETIKELDETGSLSPKRGSK